MSDKLLKWSIGTILLLWLLWVFLVYLGFHPIEFGALSDHPYLSILAGLGATLVLLGGYARRRLSKKKKWYVHFRGGYLIGAVLLLGAFVILQFWRVNGITHSSVSTGIIYYFANSLWYLLLLTLLGIGLQSLGGLLTYRLTEFKQNRLFSIAIGVMVLGFLSTLLGMVSLLYGIVLGVVLVIAVALRFRPTLDTLKHWWVGKHRWRIYHWWQLPLALLGLFFLAVYWVGGIKAFASGYDGAALYANLGELVAESHALPGAYQAFGWSVVMSWGKLLFGSLTMSLLLAHFLYVPALALAYRIMRRWLKAPYALLSVVLVLSLPMFGFLSVLDEKVDLGLLFISLAAIYLLLQYDLSKLTAQKINRDSLLGGDTYYPLLLLGGLLGFAFTIKYTTIFLLVGVVGVLSYRVGQSILYWGWLIFFIGFVFLSGFHLWGNLPLSGSEAGIMGGILTAIGLGLIGYRLYAKKIVVRPLLQGGLVVGAAFLLLFSPWAGKHFAERDYRFGLSSFLYGKPDRIAIEVGGRYLSDKVNVSPYEQGVLKTYTQLTNDQSTPQSDAGTERSAAVEEEERETGMIGNAKREELQRYLGYEEGIWRYLTIPFDLTFNLNVPGLRHQEVSFFWLGLFPVLLLFGARRLRYRGIVMVVGGIVYLAAAYWSITEAGTGEAHLTAAENMLRNYGQNNSGTVAVTSPEWWWWLQQPLVLIGSWLVGFFASLATMPAYLYVPILLLLIFGLSLAFKVPTWDWPEKLRETALLLLGFLLLWLLLGNSISWYALVAIVLSASCYIYVFQESAKAKKGFTSVYASVIGVGVLLQLALNTGLLLTSTQPGQPAAQMYNWPMVEYLTRADLDQAETLGLFDPISEQIVTLLNRSSDSRIYKVNTYLQFHIDYNDQRVLDDNQLQKFDQITSMIETPSDFVNILRENEFEYLLYDINTPSLDKTPERSLVTKCRNFLQVLLTHPGVELVLTDNYVAAPQGTTPIRLPNGQTAVAQPGLSGNTAYPGRVALFRIK